MGKSNDLLSANYSVPGPGGKALSPFFAICIYGLWGNGNFNRNIRLALYPVLVLHDERKIAGDGLNELSLLKHGLHLDIRHYNWHKRSLIGA